MAIKYTRDLDDQPEPHRHVRFARYAATPPSRRASMWIMVGTALVVALLMFGSQVAKIRPPDNTVWVQATAVSIETVDGEAVLRIELDVAGDQPPPVYDISLSGQEGLVDVAPGERVRLHAKLDDEGNIANILRVERAEPADVSEDDAV